MASPQSQRISFTTPTGTVRPYAWLTKPDFKYHQQGKFQCELVLVKADPKVQAMMKKIEEVAKETHDYWLQRFEEDPIIDKRGKRADPPAEQDLPFWEHPDDPELVIFKFSSNFKRKKKDKTEIEVYPGLVDAKGRRIAGERPMIGGGSQVKIKFGVRGYGSRSMDTGATLDLDSLMIVSLSQFGGDDWSDEVEEDGWTAPEESLKGGSKSEGKGAPQAPNEDVPFAADDADGDF